MAYFNGIQTQTALPRTIEEATRRYLNNYERNYVGSAHDLHRLKDKAHASILYLRKVAPKFYEEKLYMLVNQAASQLLTCNISNTEGQLKFHQLHRYFLKVLEALRKSQPAGDVNFETERSRIEAEDELLRRKSELKKKIQELEATEFDYDELGEEEADGLYKRTFDQLDILKKDLKLVLIKLAYIAGQKIEEEAKFELKVPQRSILNRLTREQLTNLEAQMLEFYKANNKKKNALFVDKSIIDGMLDKLNIDMSLFTKEELRHVSKDALDAFKSYFREIEFDRRNEFYDDLLRKQHLRPKEGIIFNSPEDVPEEVKNQLEQNEMCFKREMDNLLNDYGNRDVDEVTADPMEDSDDEDDDTPRVLEICKQQVGSSFERVKEEPRDDYDEFNDFDPLVDGENGDEGAETSGPEINMDTTDNGRQKTNGHDDDIIVISDDE